MSYKDQFLDFDPATMPAIPEGFEDHSWRNDVSPSFLDDQRGLVIWVDFADPQARELPDSPRYLLQIENAPTNLYEGDDWGALLAALDAYAPTSETLSARFQKYAQDHRFPEGDAMEVLAWDDLTDDSRRWVSRFVQVWDAAQGRPGFWGD